MAETTAVVTMKNLLEAGVHFGHQTRRWNPKMKRFIFGERNGIYIIDLQQTLERIDTAYRFVRGLAEDGGTVLFVGTKKQTQEPIQKQADRANSPYVNYRWLGGMLTNFQTVHARVAKLRELEGLVASGETEQMIKKEGLKVKRELAKLERNLGGIRNLERPPERDLRDRHQEGAHRGHRGEPARDPRDRGRRHQLRPGLIDYVIPGNDDAIRSANLMCRIIAEAVIEGRWLEQRKHGRPTTKTEDAKPEPPPVPELTPEERAQRDAEQQAARNAAAAAQREREARLQATRAEAAAAAAGRHADAPERARRPQPSPPPRSRIPRRAGGRSE